MQQNRTRPYRTLQQRGRTWIAILIPLALIAGASAAFIYFSETQEQAPPDPAPKTLALGQDYYVMVRTIELYPTRPGGTAWDRVDGSGPDIQFNLTWQENVVFESQKKGDTLIGSWDALALDLKSAILKGKVDLAGSIDAAIVHVDQDTILTLTVWDKDLAGSDAAGTVEMNLEKFTLGDNTFTFNATDKNAIKRVVIRVIDKSLPLPELVEEATRP